jgi:hypothetical protein
MLTNFGNLSGLQCNEDKTCILPIGGVINLPFQHDDIPFQITNTVKLLGLELDNKLDCLEKVHEKTLEKISGIVRFWSRFWLSLPGRINVVKTLCLSQLSYLGCIITPYDRSFKQIEELLLKFVKGNTNIGKNKLYSKPGNGGLGLINLQDFICAQQVQ